MGNIIRILIILELTLWGTNKKLYNLQKQSWVFLMRLFLLRDYSKHRSLYSLNRKNHIPFLSLIITCLPLTLDACQTHGECRSNASMHYFVQSQHVRFFKETSYKTMGEIIKENRLHFEHISIQDDVQEDKKMMSAMHGQICLQTHLRMKN